MKKLVMTVIIFCGVVLVGCSNGNSEKDFSETGRGISNEIQEETPISEVLNKKEQQIWYRVGEEAGKDSNVIIYVFENHTVKSYSDVPLNLGDISRMTDDEIIKLAKESEAAELERSIDNSIKDYEEQLKRFNDSVAKGETPQTTDITKIDTILAVYKEISASDLKVEPVAYSLSIETDKTGNHTEEEILSLTPYEVSWPKYFDNGEGGYVFRTEAKVVLSEYTENRNFISGYAKFQIYDSWYTGLRDEDDYYFVTRDPNKDGSLSFVLDQPGAEGVTVEE